VADIFDVFYKELDSISKELFSDIEKLGTTLSSLSDAEIVALGRQIDLFTELQNKGFNTSFQKLMNGYDQQAEEVVNKYRSIFADTPDLAKLNIDAVANELQLLRDLDGEALLGRLASESKKLEASLFRGIIAGETSTQIGNRIKTQFGEEILTGDARMIARDAFSEFSRTSTFKVFDNVPEQRFRYVGSRDKRNRPACRFLLDNQKNKKGYTKKELQEIGKQMRRGELALPVFDTNKKVFIKKKEKAEFTLKRFGGFNCRHSIVAV
jgi:hypothetical protein|tara:strand:+ start:21270 stop:22070 length:801 start_codon:yes stop_codon:yes gene_type:complete